MRNELKRSYKKSEAEGRKLKAYILKDLQSKKNPAGWQPGFSL